MQNAPCLYPTSGKTKLGYDQHFGSIRYFNHQMPLPFVPWLTNTDNSKVAAYGFAFVVPSQKQQCFWSEKINLISNHVRLVGKLLIMYIIISNLFKLPARRRTWYLNSHLLQILFGNILSLFNLSIRLVVRHRRKCYRDS